MTYTIGSYLAARFSQMGLKHHFAVAGDYNLALLDQLLTNKDMTQIYCSNELNCGFSAEGYARANGAARRDRHAQRRRSLRLRCARRRVRREPAGDLGVRCAQHERPRD